MREEKYEEGNDLISMVWLHEIREKWMMWNEAIYVGSILLLSAQNRAKREGRKIATNGTRTFML